MIRVAVSLHLSSPAMGGALPACTARRVAPGRHARRQPPPRAARHPGATRSPVDARISRGSAAAAPRSTPRPRARRCCPIRPRPPAPAGTRSALRSGSAPEPRRSIRRRGRRSQPHASTRESAAPADVAQLLSASISTPPSCSRALTPAPRNARAGFEDQVAGRRFGPAGVARTTTSAAVMRFPARRLPYRGCPRTARLRPA